MYPLYTTITKKPFYVVKASSSLILIRYDINRAIPSMKSTPQEGPFSDFNDRSIINDHKYHIDRQ